MKRISARRRRFRIWQKTGERPFHRVEETQKTDSGFFKGSFDSIPFMNEDAKRTFAHLLLRPGYMIRDYLSGKSEQYLAPMTALLVFYAFFSLVSSILSPNISNEPNVGFDTDLVDEMTSDSDISAVTRSGFADMVNFIKKVYVMTNLDLFPEEIDTAPKASLASLEANLRSQGIQEFLGTFFILWGAVVMLRKKRTGFSVSASATVSAYILCQYSFFKLFTLLITFGANKNLGLLLMAAIMAVDYKQIFDVSPRRSIWLTILTGLNMMVVFLLLLLLAGGFLYLTFFR